MPIYEYRCGVCEFRKGHLMKVSDPQQKPCPACGSQAYTRQLTAPAFSIEGPGVYSPGTK